VSDGGRYRDWDPPDDKRTALVRRKVRLEKLVARSAVSVVLVIALDIYGVVRFGGKAIPAVLLVALVVLYVYAMARARLGDVDRKIDTLDVQRELEAENDPPPPNVRVAPPPAEPRHRWDDDEAPADDRSRARRG
jgi:hypothetical protein